MNMYLIWPLWFIASVVAVAGSFAGLEAYALKTGRPTLSRFVWELTYSHPAITHGICLFGGMLIGGLFVHFWWGGMISFAPVKKLFGAE